MFRTVPLSIIRSPTLYTQQTCMYCCVYSEKKNADDGHRNCPKHVEFYSKNKFEKLVHLVCFIIRIFSLIFIACHTPVTFTFFLNHYEQNISTC